MTVTQYQSARSFLDRLDTARSQNIINGEHGIGQAYLDRNEQRLISAVRSYARQRFPEDHPVRYTLSEAGKTVVKGLTAGSLLWSGARAAAAQENKPQEPSAQTTAATDIIGPQISPKPDAAFPNSKHFLQLEGLSDSGDYKGNGFGIQGRTEYEQASVALNVRSYDGDAHPSRSPLLRPFPQADFTSITNQNTDPTLDSLVWSVKMNYGPASAFLSRSTFDKRYIAMTDGIFFPDPQFFLDGNEIEDHTLESASTVAGLGYRFTDKLMAEAGFLSREMKSRMFSSITDRLTDMTTTPPTVISTNTDTIDQRDELLQRGAWGSVTYAFAPELQTDVTLMLLKREFETRRDSVFFGTPSSSSDAGDETSIRGEAAVLYNDAMAGIGFITNNIKGENKVLAKASYNLWFNDSFALHAGARIDDLGHGAYRFGFVGFDRARQADLHRFTRSLDEIDITNDDLQKHDLFSDHLQGLGRQGGIFVGAETYYDDTDEVYRLRPLMVINPGLPVWFTAMADLGKERGLVFKEYRNTARGELHLTIDPVDAFFGVEYAQNANLNKVIGLNDEKLFYFGVSFRQPK